MQASFGTYYIAEDQDDPQLVHVLHLLDTLVYILGM
jgi:hypothetical protein